MAGGGGPKWPGPVTFNDDDPKKGFFTLFLTLKEMKIKKAVFSKATAKNAEFNDNEMFETGMILMRAKVTNTNGEEIEYEYRKALPEDIAPEQCSYKLKNDQIVLNVCKAESVSWAQHAKYMIKRD